jgi:phage-related protein
MAAVYLIEHTIAEVARHTAFRWRPPLNAVTPVVRGRSWSPTSVTAVFYSAPP